MNQERVYELITYYIASKKATEKLLESNIDDEKLNTARIGLQIFEDTVDILKNILLENEILNKSDGDDSAE